MIKIVGIDPGLAGTGIGVIQGDRNQIRGYSFGSIETHTKNPIHFRLHIIYSKILEFLCSQKPDRVIIEDIYSLEKYPGSGIMLGKVSGVLLLAAYEAGLEVEEIPVREVKKIICGNGSADKYQVERAVRNLINHDCEIRPFHASDALGLALAGYYRHKRIL
ncbi:MAG: crossover junction endodeoxyribonuclease RuvC [Proteobacteria bacterium]|nr:crossover junction endodeoxyribonuclease RuvC [Pseudomonadota bacterium]MBU1389431.1 crossover junction endodeoxyribonuclease RuvC [Pseudomonadota bacterium]MBU1541251.1 crossover junction endodeoxyribonuclease RuvC [Pseudomonadota bacterium]MBU2482443.1 crossover junction endodeoxyribonuclease RuvC [Pseudomonadota bacterium]